MRIQAAFPGSGGRGEVPGERCNNGAEYRELRSAQSPRMSTHRRAHNRVWCVYFLTQGQFPLQSFSPSPGTQKHPLYRCNFLRRGCWLVFGFFQCPSDSQALLQYQCLQGNLWTGFLSSAISTKTARRPDESRNTSLQIPFFVVPQKA